MACVRVRTFAGSRALRFDDADKLATARAFLFELDVSVLLGEQRVVAADADIAPGMETCASLAHDDVAGNNFLAAVDLHA